MLNKFNRMKKRAPFTLSTHSTISVTKQDTRNQKAHGVVLKLTFTQKKKIETLNPQFLRVSISDQVIKLCILQAWREAWLTCVGTSKIA